MAQKWQESSVFQYTSLDFANLILRKDVCTRKCVNMAAAAHKSNNVRLNDHNNAFAVILTYQ